MERTGYHDLPVNELREDLFNVEQYVNGLCKFILHCDTPMTISIQGDWGSGKTSMMNMINTNLGTKILPIWFNTWQFSQFQLGNTLAISMMEILLKKLEGDPDTFKKISGTLAALMKNAAMVVTEMHTGSSTLASKTGQVIDTLFSSSYVDEISALKEQFQNAVDNRLSKESNNKRVVVFIDDLDRLQPLKAIELLEVLKLFLDCKNCVFILAIDYEVVTLGIRQKYGSDIDAAKGKSFFDKIIQLPFKMPVSRYDINKYAESMMAKMNIKDKTHKNIELFSSLIRHSIGLNPRGMKRLFNAYQLLYNIMEEGAPPTANSNSWAGTQKIKMDILKQRIIFATVCMQMKFDAVYDYLSIGNVDIDMINKLSAIDDNMVRHFLQQQSISDSTSHEISDESILDVLFDKKMSIEELSPILQKLPSFIEYFIKALHTSDSTEISKTAIDYLRDILKSSDITSVRHGEEDDQKTKQRQINRELAQKANNLLKDIGDFKIAQAKSTENGLISSVVAGYLTYTEKINNKEYKLRYVLNNVEDLKVSVSIYINGHNQDHSEFYEFMGEDPLGYYKDYANLPVTNKAPGWYLYEQLFYVDTDDETAPKNIASRVRDAYNRLTNYIKSHSC